MMATFEMFRGGHWRPTAVLTAFDESRGFAGACQFEYLPEYAAEFASAKTSKAAGLSCRMPTDFQLYELDHWPAFVLDLLPSGYGRQQWLELLDLQKGPAADWPLLLRGTAFPPGNLRVAEAVLAKDMNLRVPTSGGSVLPMNDHPGFTCDEVVERHEAFIEYAFEHGIYAAGASDVQGVAPKLLLAQDYKGAWHAEGRLGDADVASHWIVKRPRGDHPADRKVLKNEAAYMRVAKRLGLNVFAELKWQQDNLFVPRFDRIVERGKVLRIGMESLYSAVGAAEYGARITHETACAAIEAYCSSPAADVNEYIRRDVVNVVMGNKDNHGRNTALLRHESGKVELCPLFDFAPMYLDPEGIARSCRWSRDVETAGEPEWGKVIEKFARYRNGLRTALHEFGCALQRLPEIMRDCGVDDDVIEHCTPAVDHHAKQLQDLGE